MIEFDRGITRITTVGTYFYRQAVMLVLLCTDLKGRVAGEITET